MQCSNTFYHDTQCVCRRAIWYSSLLLTLVFGTAKAQIWRVFILFSHINHRNPSSISFYTNGTNRVREKKRQYIRAHNSQCLRKKRKSRSNVEHPRTHANANMMQIRYCEIYVYRLCSDIVLIVVHNCSSIVSIISIASGYNNNATTATNIIIIVVEINREITCFSHCNAIYLLIRHNTRRKYFNECASDQSNNTFQ